MSTDASAPTAAPNPVKTASQFSLRSLMIWMTAFCCLCAVVAVPGLLAVVAVFSAILFSGVLTITIWKGRGWAQAFAAGAVVPHVCALFAMFGATDPIEAAFILLGIELMAMGAGVGAASFHGYLVRRNGMLPVPNLPLIRNWFANDPFRYVASASCPQNQSTLHETD